MDFWYQIIDKILPFSWAQYAFMKNALAALLLCAPALALCSTMVVSNRLVFFSDVLGHSALAGVALGAFLGLVAPQPAMLVVAVSLAFLLNILRRISKSSYDTILGVLFAAVTAAGVMLLSKFGFGKFSLYLVGDVLAAGPSQILSLAVILLMVLIYWVFCANALVLISVNQSLAGSRGIKVFFIETLFSFLIAAVVTFSISLVGILMVNSLLVLPAACARNFTNNTRQYTFWAVLISLVCCSLGLILSYYWGTAAGATIALLMTVAFVLSLIAGKFVHRPN